MLIFLIPIIYSSTFENDIELTSNFEENHFSILQEFVFVFNLCNKATYDEPHTGKNWINRLLLLCGVVLHNTIIIAWVLSWKNILGQVEAHYNSLNFLEDMKSATWDWLLLLTSLIDSHCQSYLRLFGKIFSLKSNDLITR